MDTLHLSVSEFNPRPSGFVRVDIGRTFVRPSGFPRESGRMDANKNKTKCTNTKQKCTE